MNKFYSKQVTLVTMLLVFVFTLSSTVSFAQLATWELSASAGNQASNATTTTGTNIGAGTLTRGPGVTATAAGACINSSGWFNSTTATTLAQAITNNEYYTFTLPVNPCFKASVTQVSMYIQSSNTGPNTVSLLSSADGFVSTLGTATSTTTSTLVNFPVSLSNVMGTLTFRLYAYGAAAGGGTPATGGTFRIGTSPTASANDLIISGTTMSSAPTASVISGSGTLCGPTNNISNIPVKVNITGGTSPYTVIISDGTTNTTINSYVSGAAISLPISSTKTYTIVSVTDANGCVSTGLSGSANVTILNVAISGVLTQPTCANVMGGAINISLVPGGTYTFDWGDIPGTSNVEDRTGLMAGTYLVTVTEAVGCSVVGSYTLNAPTGCSGTCSLTSVALTGVHCENNNETPAQTDDYIWFSLNPTGTNLGTGFNVTVNTGSILLNAVSPTTNIPYGSIKNFRLQAGSAGGGNVTITVTDVANPSCTLMQLITDPGSCSVSATSAVISGNGTLCGAGNIFDVPVMVDIIGGVGPYTLVVSNGATNATITNYISGTPIDLPITATSTYTLVSVTDANALSITSLSGSAVVQIMPNNIMLTSVITQPSCANLNGGAINITITGGTLPYNIGWSNNEITEDISSLAPGDYSVFVTDGMGCTKSADFTLTTPTGCPGCAMLSSVVTNTTCGLNNGAINLTQVNGVAPIVYAWSNGANTEDISNLAVGTYFVTVTSAGCIGTGTSISVMVGTATNPPSISCPPDVNVGCNSAVPAPNLALVTATDDCGVPTKSVMPNMISAQTCAARYTITRVYKATDSDGLIAQCTQIITVNDQTAPIFNQAIPPNLMLSCVDVIPAPAVLTATDGCDPGVSPPVIWINEIHYDNVGTDAGESVEVAGTAGLDLTQYQLVYYNGNDGTAYSTVSLTGTIDNEGASGFGAINFPLVGIQNGAPDGVALVKLPSTVLQFLSYEGSFAGTSGVALGLTSTDVVVLENGSNALNTSLQLTGTGQNASAFSWVGPITATPGTLNAGQIVQPQMGIITPVFQQTMMAGTCAGAMTIKRTWTATDACGNSTMGMQTIQLLDNTAPTFAPPLPMDMTIDCNTAIPVAPNLIATDACDMGAAAAERVWINEIHYDNTGADVGEFVEIAGTAGLDLATNTYQLVFYNGSTPASALVYNTINLTGVIDNESNGIGALQFAVPALPLGIQNGPNDAVALVRNGIVIQFLSYEGVTTANGGPANAQTSTDIGVAENGTEVVGLSIRLTGTGNLYTNFAWQAPNAAVPATPGSLNTGQIITPLPAPFPVTFSQTVVPGTCPRSSVITRKWSAQDGCGNMVMHQQVITQRDTMRPILTCPSFTVNIPNSGTVTLSHVNVPFTTSDNCTLTPALVVTSNTITINCANSLATPVLTIRSTDECGNFRTCNVPLVINSNPRCVPKILVTDPCICKDNATTLTNGQFDEKIKIESLTGMIWKITAVTGLYSATSPAPPAAPTPLLIGATLVENPVGSGDYFLNGVHVDDLGYSLTVTNQFAASLNIANKCAYPNPTITSVLDGPFCLFSNAVPLTGTPGDANFVSAVFTINGVPATTFDPMAGVGVYVIKYTVNGGTHATMVGPNDPICTQMVTKTVEVVATPSNVVCDDFTNVSLEADCSTDILPGMILEGSIACFDDYKVIITAPNGTILPNATVTANNIGQTFMVTVKHLPSGNSCWGTILVEDKLPPTLVCADITVPCVVSNLTPNGLASLNIPGAFPISSDCSTYTVNFSDTFYDLACGAGVGPVANASAYIRRDWIATDAFGQVSTCIQNIYVQRLTLSDLSFPDNASFSCENPSTAPSRTGAPYFTFKNVKYNLLPNNTFCELSVAYNDEVLTLCGGTTETLRTWVVIDWCLPTSATNPRYFVQEIKITDSAPPTFTCPANISVNTNSFDCEKDQNLPDVLVSDNCSGLASIKASWTLDQFFNYSLAGTFAPPPSGSTAQKLGVLGIAENLTPGDNLIKYEITDNCGNVKTCNFKITVVDSIPPNPICTEVTQVSLGLDGTAFLPATAFDQGSYDNCSTPVYLKARRLNNSSCQSAGSWQDEVKFCCSDVGTTVQVAMRVWDVSLPTGSISLTFKESNSNECMIQVLVDEKIKPICVPPPTYSVNCESYDPTLWNYGQPTITDNCCLDNTKTVNFGNGNVRGVSQSLDYSAFDQTCNRGTIKRNFTAYDCNGNTSVCSQNIVVNYIQNYSIKFPDDVDVTTCNGVANFGTPTFTGKDCELTAVSYDDQVYTIVNDACRKIERTWTVINWCSYNANLACLQVNNPGTSNIGATYAPTANFNQCITYKQIIKINDQIAPTVNEPVADTCDYSANNEFLWNDVSLFDVAHSSHDLCEGGGVISVSGNDDCSGNDVQFRALLFIDLDNDGGMETVLNTNDLNPPPVGSMWVNNANNANFAGTTSLVFDKRNVPANQKYKIGLEITTAASGQKTATLRFSSNGTWSAPQLPYGRYKIKWIISDGCGNETVKEKIFTIKDCKKPTVVCRNGLSVNLMNNPNFQGVTLWASDFLQYAEDNCTPPIVEPYSVVNNPLDQLTYAIIRSDDPAVNAGFPINANGTPRTSVSFNCPDAQNTLPTLVKLWAKDKAGNADFCEAFISVQDNMNVCPGDNFLTLAGALRTETAQGLEEANVAIQISHPVLPPWSVFETTSINGAYVYHTLGDINATITPEKDDNPLNGVTTYDLLLISKHILGVSPLSSPYKMIAADVNKSNSITTFDIVELRKLILGIYNELPNNTSWRFVDKSFAFADPTNPFTQTFPESKSLNTITGVHISEDFVAMKVGDVNGNAVANNLMNSDDRSTGVLHFETEDREIKAGETFTIQFNAAEKALGYQFTLQYDGLELVEIQAIEGVKNEDFAVFNAENALTTSYFGDKKAVFALTFRAITAGKLSKKLSLSSRITKAEAYNTNAEKQEVALTFRNEAGVNTTAGVGFELYQNTPNPFQNSTVIGFNMPTTTEATLTVYEETGRVLLVKKGNFAKGYNNIQLRKEELQNGSGLLYYQLKTSEYQETRKMVILK
jgi:hypothetical protein